MDRMDRRRMLESAAALIGLAALPEAAFAAAGKVASARPAVLDRPGLALVSAVADTLIPRTDTPGALQAGVPAKFHGLLRDWANPVHRAALIAALGKIDAAAKSGAGKPFALLPAAKRTEVLRAYDSANLKADPDYARLKELLCMVYYFSEPGATVELRYEHVPGAWEPSIPITAATRTWAGAAG